ncbi:MAG: nucleotidyltransferase family protein [Anaeroplasmataceae bacterium]|nr:nucleotidyltransferase family protein [Anaeroplasmataceae bacterium]
MKVVGTIVEYNPLHNGHLYAINKIRELSKADIIIAILSGNYTMRGDLSIFDKFEKTRQALKASIDLVIELPFVLAVQHSDVFAKNAIKQLYLAGVQEVWIGSESNNPKLYENCYKNWKKEESQEKIKSLLALGKSYKEATASIIDLPSNDLLGFCYYKAIQECQFEMRLHTIQRVGNYNSLETGTYASAYAIRNNLSLMDDFCPSYVNSSFIRDSNLLFPYLKYQILSLSTEELKHIFFVEEGIENRLKNINTFFTLKDFIDFLSTKRYTKSRIQRMLAYILFQIKKSDMSSLSEYSILRILGYSPNGKKYLSTLKKKTWIQTNIKEGIHPILDFELKITKILDMIYSSTMLKDEQGKPQEI